MTRSYDTVGRLLNHGGPGYCKCGGVLAVHEPYLTQLFEWMRKIDR